MGFKVGADLGDFSTQIQKKHDDLVGLIQRIQTNSETLIGKWDGDAQRAYRGVMDNYFDKARRLNTDLEHTGENVAQSGKSFIAQDSSFGSQIGQAGGGFDGGPAATPGSSISL
ncbi:WXG100 family type VII secretion target [Nocardia terpenica]|uniref:WXG100 family type VII secretion target n=1 Tax=Nocardia terpenica TaxID=455432 RepID=A0A6G9YWZ6_9NOCA|nr:WXG100 family type VII secretion target [Nocardia terpenica]QIS17845.1 WXG100 family type VII secretion target [Nocardia terpenica]